MNTRLSAFRKADVYTSYGSAKALEHLYIEGTENWGWASDKGRVVHSQDVCIAWKKLSNLSAWGLATGKFANDGGWGIQ